jgi:hypothetical protein
MKRFPKKSLGGEGSNFKQGDLTDQFSSVEYLFYSMRI